ncbi:hypothetical protein GGER_34610 [Serratia rubidaea]
MVIEAEDLIEIGSQGVSMKLVHNGSPTRNLAMMLETYQPGSTTGEKSSIRARRSAPCWKVKSC